MTYEQSFSHNNTLRLYSRRTIINAYKINCHLNKQPQGTVNHAKSDGTISTPARLGTQIIIVMGVQYKR